MYLYSEATGTITNMDHVITIFVGRDGNKLVAKEDDGMILLQQAYTNEAEPREAVVMVAEQVRNARSHDAVLTVPNPETVRERIRAKPAEVWHHATGKKTKGHGGS